MSQHDLNAAFQQAVALQRQGDATSAAEIYQRLLRADPGNAVLLLQLASAKMQLEHFDEAITLLRRSLRADPSQFRAHGNLGLALKETGRPQEALASFDRAIALSPGYAIAHNNRALVQLSLGQQDAALESFDRALAAEPGYAEAHNNRGSLLRDREQLEEALACFSRAVGVAPDYALAHCNRGITQNELGRPKQALASFDHVLALAPGMANAHCGRAVALFNLKQLDEARKSNERAIALDPDHAEAHWNAARLSLVMGDFAAGWDEQEWRWKLYETRDAVPPFIGAEARPSLWTGAQALSGKTILVQNEQGFGDFVQFCRYLPMLRALGAKVIVQARARLVPLLKTLAGEYDFVTTDEPLPAFDVYCPIMSLPRAFGTRLETIPANVPYLFAEAQKRMQVEARLGAKTMPRIGLAWSGNPGHKSDNLRSIKLEKMVSLVRLPFEFHCLQKEITPADRAMMAAQQIGAHHDEQNDFSDAAALVDAMDLVITVDTVIAHIAGAMGKPVWILLTYMADWRWLLDRPDSPWYPSATLFRQAAPGDWPSVITAVNERLNRSGVV